MSAIKIIIALAAIGVTAVTAQCSEPTITVTSPSAATIDCTTVEGSVVFEESDSMTGDIIIDGPKSIKGDLIVNGTKTIVSLTSTSIGTIGGKFQVQGAEQLSKIDFSALQTVGEIEWITLPALNTLDFGRDGVTTVKTVTISDTFLSSLDGLNMVSVGTFSISNNLYLTTWETQMTNITEKVQISENSDSLEVSFPKLTWANSIEIRGIKSLDVPVLEMVNTSMTFDDNNEMESFVAPNLVETGDDLVFINNNILNNLSFPILEKTGSLRIQNNQELVEINGFPELVQVNSDVKIRGNFTEVSLPKLNDVKGAFDIQSTEDISSSCDTFQKLSPTSSGGGGQIQGKYNCDSGIASANEGSDDEDADDEDAAAFLAIDKTLVAVAAVVGLYQLW